MLLSPTNPPPPSSTLFPYTTLFRSLGDGLHDPCDHARVQLLRSESPVAGEDRDVIAHPPFELADQPLRLTETAAFRRDRKRHTSELQSQSNLVCRLLLEKKNNSTAQ